MFGSKGILAFFRALSSLFVCVEGCSSAGFTVSAGFICSTGFIFGAGALDAGALDADELDAGALTVPSALRPAMPLPSSAWRG